MSLQPSPTVSLSLSAFFITSNRIPYKYLSEFLVLSPRIIIGCHVEQQTADQSTMGMQLNSISRAHFNPLLLPATPCVLLPSSSSCNLKKGNGALGLRKAAGKKHFYVAASSNVGAPLWESWAPEKSSKGPSLSDIVWPSAGAFAAMALLGKLDQILAQKGLSMTIAPLGAVCAVLFAAPSSPGARKYNMFVAQIGCAAIGVLAYSVLGPGWLARSTGLAAALAFMILTRSVHPPAASLPLVFIDAAKFHHLNFWYALFPGAAACILLSLIQEIVCYLKDNLKF